MLTEVVRERLAHLLAENRPRRASASDVSLGQRRAVFDRAAAAQPRQVGSGPDFEPSDDGDDLEDAVDGHRNGPRRVGLPPSSDQPRRERGRDQVDDDEWEDVSRRRSFGRAHVGVICALLLIGLLSAGWAVLRARPVAIASTAASSSLPSAARSSTPAPSTSPSPSRSTIMVHVLGAVEKPGVVTLPEQSRVRDAINAAGGLRDHAAPGDLNLAQVLGDGQQVVIGTDKDPNGEVRNGSEPSDPTDGSASEPGSGSSDSSGAKVNLNSANQSQLEELPGVGPVTAGKIVAWREEHGRFSRVEELQEIDGIGPKTFAEIAPHVRV